MNKKEIIRYIFVGVLTTLVSLIIFYGLLYFFFNQNNVIHLQIANIIAWMGSVTFSFFLSKVYVFKNTNKVSLIQIAQFYGGRATTLFVENAGLYVFVSSLGIDAHMVKIYLLFFSIVMNYIISKLIVFKEE